jgi:hypothetical protein
MSATDLLPEALPAVAPSDWARPLVERQLQMLGRLAEAGLEIAVALEAQAKGGEPVVQGDVAMAYNRVARAVRQTIMLQSKLIEDLREQETGVAGDRAAARARAAGLIGGVIDHERKSDREPLRAEAAERLRQEDFSDLLARPFAEAVAGIVRDLGLAPDWLALYQDCWSAEAALCGRGGASAAEPDDDPLKIGWLDDLYDDDPPGEDSASPDGAVDWRKRRLGRHAP